MKMIIPLHKRCSSKITEFTPEIDKLAKELQDFFDNGQVTPPGINKYGLALHHSQVEAVKPLNFFVMRRRTGDPEEAVLAFFNPKIIGEDRGSVRELTEGCLSFPFRADKKVLRYTKIQVSYDLPHKEKGEKEYKFKHYEEWVEGQMAQIFQHEINHAHGKNIYN